MSPQSNGCQRKEDRPASAIGALGTARGASALKAETPLDQHLKVTDVRGASNSQFEIAYTFVGRNKPARV